MDFENKALKERLMDGYSEQCNDLDALQNRPRRSRWSNRLAYVAYLLVAILLPMNAILVSKNYQAREDRFLAVSRFCE